MPQQQQELSSMRSFTIAWFGQMISAVGTGLTGFALGVWVYQTTGSVTLFSLISLFVVLPGVLVLPIAGAVVDRWDRRWIIIGADTIAGLTTAIIALLIYFDRLEIWYLYFLLSIASMATAFQGPAFSAATTLMVGKKNLGRAAGMSQLIQAAGMILGPLIAPVLQKSVGLSGVILVDVLTFLFATACLLSIRIPRPTASKDSDAISGSLLREALFGWKFIRQRPGLLALLAMFACVNLGLGFVQILITPIVLSTASEVVLGRVLAIASLGLVVGGVIVSVWGGPKRRIRAVVLAEGILGILLVLAGPQQTALGLGSLAFLFMVGVPIILSASQALWQSKVAPDLQGRVFAIRRMVAYSSLPLAYLLVGPASDYLFKPLLAADGSLAATLGPFFGVGTTRGLGLFLSSIGLFLFFVALAGRRYGPLWRLEDELPDALPEVPATSHGASTSLEPEYAGTPSESGVGGV